MSHTFIISSSACRIGFYFIYKHIKFNILSIKQLYGENFKLNFEPNRFSSARYDSVIRTVKILDVCHDIK